ncbi:microtubule-destabilizing protein 60 isoform X1 [Arachis stenosperma]|uniref:microtubule-destabilizing protein 60 isoform X1 n=1 Tax=Arachis stenosperma TaxID=217475 RepID=UPI0025ABA3F2|nr:microtubule-destabilizing protein 60 isoform X1 [Arachis stenosperma]
MEKASTKSSLKFVKNTSQSTAAQWSITNNNARGMARDEVKDRFYDKNNKSSSSQSRKSSPPKENTKPQEFKLHTQERAVKRAMFNYAVTTKFYLMEIQKRQAEKLQKMIEEEEIRMLRKEMVPRAQLMPYFDKPFSPQSRSNNKTVGSRESYSCLHMMSSKCLRCCSLGNEFHNLHHSLKPVN